MIFADVVAIVPAAGRGARIRQPLPKSLSKPYLPVGGKPILARTLETLQAVPEIRGIVVACEPRYRPLVRRLAALYGITKLQGVVRGGATRTDSVGKALARVPKGARYVLVHDGVRPFLSGACVRRMIAGFRTGSAHGCVLARPVTPTVKEVRNGRVVRTLDREGLWEIETPQLFKKEALRAAYRHYGRSHFRATDDASLVEEWGGRVAVFPATEMNMKITTPEDLRLAQRLFAGGGHRTGWGEDRHRLEKGRPLYLGGLRIPAPFGAVGHSDGDVILHAVMDALLGASGLGDIGDFFPDTGRRWRGARSEKMLGRVLALVGAKGLRPVHMDCTVILEKPRLSVWKKRIQKRMAVLLGLPEDAVGVKAKTAEGAGPEGRGEMIAAHAVATVARRDA